MFCTASTNPQRPAPIRHGKPQARKRTYSSWRWTAAAPASPMSTGGGLPPPASSTRCAWRPWAWRRASRTPRPARRPAAIPTTAGRWLPPNRKPAGTARTGKTAPACAGARSKRGKSATAGVARRRSVAPATPARQGGDQRRLGHARCAASAGAPCTRFTRARSHPHMPSITFRRPPQVTLATLGPFIALILACAFLASQSERFLSAQNFSLILQQVMVVAVIAIGQTLVILTAGIDLSCGMVMALGSIVMTKMAASHDLSAPLAIACGIAVTVLFGLVSGLLVTKIALPPFIVTLGTMNIAFAITQLYSDAQTITDIPEGMTLLGGTFALGQTAIVWGAVLMLALYLIVWFALRETAPGRHVYAVGNNPEA